MSDDSDDSFFVPTPPGGWTFGMDVDESYRPRRSQGAMSQADQSIQPALTPEEWAEALAWPHGVTDYIIAPAEQLGYGKNSPAHIHAVAALANAALPDNDPRKITREMVNIIREAGKRIGREGNPHLGFEANLTRYADVLAALLPPE